MYDSSKTGNVTMSASMSQNTHGTLTATLSGAQQASLASLSNPRHLAILPGGVTDIWNNTNGAPLKVALAYGDPNTMRITSAEYGVGTGILNVTISEDVLRYNHTKIILEDSSNSVSLGSADFAERTPGILTMTLNSTKKAAFEGLSHPRNVTIQAGGVVDIWNRANQESLTLTASYDETIPPTLSSAKYSSATGVLTLTLSERLDLPDKSNAVLYDKRQEREPDNFAWRRQPGHGRGACGHPGRQHKKVVRGFAEPPAPCRDTAKQRGRHLEQHQQGDA